MSKISKISTYDLRFPTSATLSGSDAMNPDPDYSSAYHDGDTAVGDANHVIAFGFTIRRGYRVVIKGIERLSQRFVGQTVQDLLDAMKMAWDMLVHDSQLRWLWPE